MLIRFSENKNIRTNDLLHLRKRLIARTQGPNGRERTTPRLIPNYLETIFLYKGTQQKPSGIGKRLQKPSVQEFTQLAN